MWVLLIVFVAIFLGLNSRMSQREARFAIIPVILVVIGYQAVKLGLM